MKNLIKVDKSQRTALAIAMVAAIVVAVFFLQRYLLLVVVAAIVAFIFNPVYKKLLTKGRSPSSAASITLLVTILSFVIPVSLLVAITSVQVVTLLDTIKQSADGFDLGNIGQRVVNSANDVFTSLGLNIHITSQSITSAATKAVEGLGETLLKNAWASINGIFGFITIAIIYIYVFISLLKNQDAIFRIFHKINPLGRQISELYVARMGSMTKAMVRGQFIIATLQGLTDAALLYIGGIHTAFFFFAVVLIALSIIPLGGGILVLPIGVVMLLTGNIVGGLIVILGHLLIVTNIDNIMRPRLVPKEARLDPALTLLAVFSGVTLFGFIGIILGPVLMIVLVTTLQVYLEVFKGENAVQDGETQTKVSLSKRFGKFFASK